MSDAIRSLARYTSEALGDDFEIAWVAEHGTFERPYARIRETTGVQSVAIGARHAELRQSFGIVAYPFAFPTETAGMVEAQRVRELLWRAFAQGIDPQSFSTRSDRAHPLRVPLFDYSQTGLREAATDADRIGYLHVVEAPTFDVYADPEDARSLLVAATLRLAWTRYVGRPVGGEAAEAVTATVGAEG